MIDTDNGQLSVVFFIIFRGAKIKAFVGLCKKKFRKMLFIEKKV